MKGCKSARVATSIFLAALFVALAACETETEGEKGISMYAAAQSGLIIRSEPTTESAKLGLIPYGSSLTVLEQAGDTTTILGRQGRWSKVEFQGIQGWVFGGFLSANAPPKLVKEDKCAPFKKCYAKCEELLAGPGYEMCMDECYPAWAGLEAACDPNLQ
ncbi:MAG: SH3 domain-containing protein [Leptospiraceae bacterium]|nr:SH3 domain-containing protein [Leptospiraceae bacterium]